MNILFLGDIVGNSGCSAVKNFLPNIVKSKKINFVVVNGENAANEGVGITENIVNELLSCGVDVITTGNHVWDQKEIMKHIDNALEKYEPGKPENKVTGSTMPVVWKKHYGKGRIFYSSIGHKLTDFDVPEVMTIQMRGFRWAAEGKYMKKETTITPGYK